MIGLIGFQAYWINNAIEVSNVKFNQNVHEALNHVVSNLEKREVYYAASKQINNRSVKNRKGYRKADGDNKDNGMNYRRNIWNLPIEQMEVLQCENHNKAGHRRQQEGKIDAF